MHLASISASVLLAQNGQRGAGLPLPADGSVVVRAEPVADQIEVEGGRQRATGSPPDERERVFTAFYRGGADAGRTGGGSALAWPSHAQSSRRMAGAAGCRTPPSPRAFASGRPPRRRLSPVSRLRHLAPILVVAVAAALVTAPWASGKGRTEKLTGVVTQEHRGPQMYTTAITIALRRGGKAVGKLTLPDCTGAGSTVICGGEMKLKGLGSHLSVLFQWPCNPNVANKCPNSATSLYIDNKSGKSFGSMTLKTGPGLKKGKHFPVIVKLT